jgi:hypothetical protein
MLHSIVFAFLARRLSTHKLASESLAGHLSRSFKKTAIYELFAWTLLILTSAALIWIVAPLVLLGIRLCSPTAAALLNFAPPGHCTVSVDDWFVVKRVLVGYLGLCLVLGLVFLVGCVSLHLLCEKRQGTVHHWSVFLDDSDYE